MKHYTGKIIAAFAAVSFASCTDSLDCFMDKFQKPDEVAVNEELNKYDILKSYIGTDAPGFFLGAKVSANDFVKQGPLYSAVVSNFTAVDVTGSFTPLNTLANDEYNFNGIKSFASVTSETQDNILAVGGNLISNQGQRAEYLNSLLEPVFIPFVPEKGTTKILDFEDDAIGTTYPMTGGSQAVVENDPANESGHVLHVGTDADKAAYSHPKFHVKLPEGRKLGDYVRMYVDMRFVNSDGIWGAGLHLFINGEDFALGGNGSEFGAANNTWKREGVIKLNDPSRFGCDLSKYKDLTEFDLAFGATSGGAQYYIDNIVMDYEVAGGGYVDLFSFENDAVGTTYPMSGGSQAVVENDPTGEVGGKVLHVGTDADKAAYSYPKFHVKLPAGQTLGDYEALCVDMRFVNNDGIWGSGLHLFINGVDYELNGNGDAFCGGGNKWKVDGKIKLNDASTFGCVLSDEHKALNEFDLQFGAGSGGAQYYLDNIRLYWKAADKYIEKTPEEKKAILEDEMLTWIGGLVGSGANDNEEKSIKEWNIISDPLSEVEDANTFHWGEYLGTDDYVRTAVKMARDTANTTLRLYVSQTMEQYDDMAQMASDLKALVSSWEADGKTTIDGYNITLNAICSGDEEFQQSNKDMVTALLQQLAASGKMVRISGLSMMYENSDGDLIKPSAMTVEQWKEAADYMAFIISRYRQTIPSDKQAGIIISGIAGGNEYEVYPWTTGYNRTYMYEGIVNGLTQGK